MEYHQLLKHVPTVVQQCGHATITPQAIHDACDNPHGSYSARNRHALQLAFASIGLLTSQDQHGNWLVKPGRL